MKTGEMKFTKICWLGFAIGQLLIWQDAFAMDRTLLARSSARGIGSSQYTNNSGNRRSSTLPRRPGRNRQSGSPMDDRANLGNYRSGYAAGMRDGKHVAVQTKRNIRDIRSAEQYAIREHAERDARAERIYRSSQLSSPIIGDAKACKRIGAHGESIYENCQIAGR